MYLYLFLNVPLKFSVKTSIKTTIKKWPQKHTLRVINPNCHGRACMSPQTPLLVATLPLVFGACTHENPPPPKLNQSTFSALEYFAMTINYMFT